MATLETGKEDEVAAAATEDVPQVTEVEQESDYEKPLYKKQKLSLQIKETKRMRY